MDNTMTRDEIVGHRIIDLLTAEHMTGSAAFIVLLGVAASCLAGKAEAPSENDLALAQVAFLGGPEGVIQHLVALAVTMHTLQENVRGEKGPGFPDEAEWPSHLNN